MKKITLLAIVLSLLTVICINMHGGNNDDKITSSFGKKRIIDKERQIEKPIVITQVVPKYQDDTIYCLSTGKEYMWLTPSYKIPEKEAFKLPLVVRFSNKTKAGYYCSLAILGRGLKPNNVGFTMTISDFLPDSIIGTSEVIQSFSTAYRLDIIPDYTGKHVLQERLYDINNRLLGYIVHQYQNNYTLATEHYFGPDGLPVKIAKSPKYPLGLRMNVMFDNHGNDSLLYLSDGTNVIPNKDGAFYVQYVNTTNDKGEKIRIQRNLDRNFVPMIDNFGNCGGITVYDRYLNDSIHTFIDNHDNVMALPESAYDKSMINVSSRKYHINYKNFKWDTVEYLGLKGEPVQNILGTHKIVVEYDTLGNEILRKGLDLNGKLSPMDEHGVAKYTVKWDSLGNVIEYHQYDRYKKPISNNGSSSSFYRVYDPLTMREISNVGYVYNENIDTEELDYKLLYSTSVDSFLYSDKSRKVIKYDSLGRITSIRFFDKTGNPDEYAYCAIDSTQYILGNGVSKSINRRFSANGQLKYVAVYDSLLNTESFFYYDENGYKTDSYQHRYSKDGTLIGQTDCNEFGVPCRAGGNSGVRFLYTDVSRTLDGAFNSFTILDEFGESDYLLNSNGEIYASFGENEPRYKGRVLRDEFGVIIPESEYRHLRDSLPKVMTIEVVDSAAYALGIRDNDVILSYGDYSVDLKNIATESQFKIDWTVRSVLDASKEKDMVVFRVEDGKSGKYGLKTIKGLQGSPSELGFIPHIRYLTKRQTERILSCIDYGSTVPAAVEKNKYVIVDYPEMYRTRRFTQYAKKITDATIFLGGYDSTRDYKYDYRDNDNTEELSKMISPFKNETNKHELNVNYYFAKDENTIANITSSGSYVGLNLVDGYVTDSVYNALISMYEKVSGKIDQDRTLKTRLNPKKLAGYWAVEASDSLGYSNDRYIYIDKNGECYGNLPSYSYVPDSNIPEDLGSPVFRMDRLFYGSWSNVDSLIAIDTKNEFRENIQCVNILDPTENPNDVRLYFNEDYTKYTQYYDNKLLPYCGFNDLFFVKTLDKKSMTIDDGCGNEIRLKKQKIRSRTISKEYLLGSWIIEESPYSIILSFSEDNMVTMDFIGTVNKSELENECGLSVLLSMNGQWSMNQELISVVFNPSSVDYKYNYLNFGLDEHSMSEKITELENYFKNGLNDLIRSFETDNALMAMITKKGQLQLDDNIILNKLTDTKRSVVGNIEGQDGYLVESGLSGLFVVLQWGDWNCSNDIDAFEEEFEKQKNNNKKIILLPITSDENGNDVFGDPIVIECPSGKLGFRLSDIPISYPYFLKQVWSRYQMIK